MSLRYELVAPREAIPLCTARFRCGSRDLMWHADEAEFRAAWPFLKRLGYTIEDEYGAPAAERGDGRCLRRAVRSPARSAVQRNAIRRSDTGCSMSRKPCKAACTPTWYGAWRTVAGLATSAGRPGAASTTTRATGRSGGTSARTAEGGFTMTSINVGEVETFRDVAPDKAQALKVLEEAAEVFGAWQDWDRVNGEDEIKAIMRRAMVVSECADVIQATCNLLAALGVEDFGPCMAACAGRNRERGRMRWARASTCARSSPCSA